MLYDHDLKGSDLPERTLALTFDDGPGPHTRELGRYLYDEGISAAFFVIGRAAARERSLLKQLCDWGHVIGNHTWSHPGLVDLAQAGGDLVVEVAWTDALIRPLMKPPLLIRPPYGSWRLRLQPGVPENAPTSIVAGLLRASKQFEDYLGPVMWDIVGEDWEYWRRGDSVEDCLQRHLAEIERMGRGIVLLHDSSDDYGLRDGNRTAEMMKAMVPILKEKNYRFVPLEAALRRWAKEDFGDERSPDGNAREERGGPYERNHDRSIAGNTVPVLSGP